MPAKPALSEVECAVATRLQTLSSVVDVWASTISSRGENLDEWERSLDADIASNGSSEITVRGTCMLTMQRKRFLGRLDVERMRGIEGWMPSKKLIKVIEELKREGRL